VNFHELKSKLVGLSEIGLPVMMNGKPLHTKSAEELEALPTEVWDGVRDVLFAMLGSLRDIQKEEEVHGCVAQAMVASLRDIQKEEGT
jgi:hypothetical protein